MFWGLEKCRAKAQRYVGANRGREGAERVEVQFEI